MTIAADLHDLADRLAKLWPPEKSASFSRGEVGDRRGAEAAGIWCENFAHQISRQRQPPTT
jgi:hypothetical protein